MGDEFRRSLAEWNGKSGGWLKGEWKIKTEGYAIAFPMGNARPAAA